MATIFLFCITLFFSPTLSNPSLNLQVVQNDQCIVNVSEEYKKDFHDKMENGKKVFYFQVHYNSTYADRLTRPILGDYFANPNEYMWLYDGENGLPVYMNAPFDFNIYSLFLLKEYTQTFRVNVSVSDSCNVSRVNFLHLVFDQLIHIVSKAPLQDKKASAYICYDINNRKHLKDWSFKADQHLGLNRRILFRYCCKIKDNQPSDKQSVDLCQGENRSSSTILDLQNYIGAILFFFFPVMIGFIAGAKLPGYHAKFAYMRSISGGFHKGEQFLVPFGNEHFWISEHDEQYSIYSFFKWLFLFNHPSLKASRIRRSLAMLSTLLIIFISLAMEWIVLKPELQIYLDDGIPLGYLSLMFGYVKSAENTDYFLGGPYVWFSTYLILGLIIINIPDRLCETIAFSFQQQRPTCTFLIQDVHLLQRYGNLNMFNLHDYDLLYAILKSSLLTALNPSFWFAVIKRWFHRCKRLYNSFNNSNITYQLIGVSIAIPFVVIIVVLCVSELLLCIFFYGCPQLLLLQAIPHSYTLCYIKPFFRRNHSCYKILGCLLFLISLPSFLFLFLFSTYLFLTSFQLLSSYLIYTVIALIAKPDAIAYVILILIIFYFVVSILNSISETYQSLMKVSIKLAESVCKDFVYTRLGERFIYTELFQQIVEKHHPVRYEVAKAVTKLLITLCFFVSCVYSFRNINLNLSTYIKIGLLILTSMIPTIMTVLNDTILDSQWRIERILKTIHDFKEERDFSNNENIRPSI